MYKTKDSSESEMILEFLKMEIESERFAGDIKAALRSLGAGAELVLRGDAGDEEQNALRREVLGEFRGYGRNERLFKNFPRDIRWVWAVLENYDLQRISYINYSYWNELSGFTGSPLKAARAIRAGKTVYGVGNDGFFKAEEDLRRGDKFPPLILLAAENGERMIILEGHKRLTGYALAPELFQNVRALLGYCGEEQLKRWNGEL